MAKNVLPKHWNGSEFEELHIVTKASNVFTNDNKSVQQKIDDFTSHLVDYTQHPYYAGDTSSTGTGILQITLPVTYSSWSAVPIGACFSFKNIYDNQTIASGIKLALAGLAGEKPILKPNGNLFTTLTKDAIYTVRWNGVNFILQGEGASGNATASDLLSGKTATTDAGEITGTMPNRGAVSHSLAINGTYTIPEGYHNGSGQVTQSIPTKGAATITPGTTNQVIAAGQYLSGPQTIVGDANLIPENIKEGVNIFGKVGTLKPRQFHQQSVTVNGTFESVTIPFDPSIVIAYEAGTNLNSFSANVKISGSWISRKFNNNLFISYDYHFFNNWVITNQTGGAKTLDVLAWG